MNRVHSRYDLGIVLRYIVRYKRKSIPRNDRPYKLSAFNFVQSFNIRDTVHLFDHTLHSFHLILPLPHRLSFQLVSID